MGNSLILYVGEREAGQALAALVESEGGYIYLPDSLMQALGMYITYFPDVVVIDMETSYAQQVYDHLRSVDAKPVILLTDERIRIASIYTLPHDISAEELLSAIERVEERPSVLNGVLRYA
jgi:hypothetical protein